MEHPNPITRQRIELMAFAMEYPASMQVLFLYPKVVFRANVGDRLAKHLSSGSYNKCMMLTFEIILGLDELSRIGVLVEIDIFG